MGTPTALTDPGEPDLLVRRVFHQHSPRLADLVDDVTRFRTADVYRRPVVSIGAGRRDIARFARPDRLWDDLLGRSTRRPAFRLVREGTTAAPSGLTRRARVGNRDLDDLIAPNRVIGGYRDGSTVVLQGLHLSDPDLARFANNLALELDQPVQINAYLSPASARGLDIHFDYHDVFVIQLEGSKRWRVWDPIERSRDPIGGQHAVPLPRADELGPPVLDFVLRPGDVLYLPRGHPHVAETTDEASAHLTVGVLAITWDRVVKHVVDEEVRAGRLRASIPLSTLDGPAAQATADALALPVDLGSLSARRWVAKEIWRRQAVTRLRPLEPWPHAAVDAMLQPTAGPLLTLSRDGDRSLLFVGDRTISLPDEAHPFLTALLRTSGPFHRADLPGLDDASSRVVIARLMDEGVLEPTEEKPEVHP